MSTWTEAYWRAKQEAYEEWAGKANVVADINGILHAGPGGAIGMNGEFYEHGQFIATSEETERGAIQWKARAAQISREEWDQDPQCAEIGRWLEDNRPQLTGFLLDMADSLERYGSLTERQLSSTIKSRQWYLNSLVEKDERAERGSRSEHVGTIGERIEIEALIEKVITLENAYGETYCLVLIAQGDNRLVYFGNAAICGCMGETVTLRATVHEHNVREGVKQTVVKRPSVKGA